MKCRGNQLSRRSMLTVGAVGGLTLADFFRIREANADQKHYESKEGKAKSVIFIFMPGGMAHQETFDPNPVRNARRKRAEAPAYGRVSLSSAQRAMLLEGIDWRTPERTWRPLKAG